MSIDSVILSNHLSLCCSLLLLLSVFPSIRVFSNESALHIRWPKYWSFNNNSEYSGLISFRIENFDLAVQGTLLNLPQYWFESINSLALSFFMVQLSHLYISSAQLSLVAQSCPTLQAFGARLPCPSPTPRVYPNSCPLSTWCHPTISSSVIYT